MTGDEKTLTAAPGVGKKIAQRVILELKDKIGKDMGGGSVSTSAPVTVSAGGSDALNDAAAGLAVLGYSSAEIAPVINKLDTASMTAEQIIKDVNTCNDKFEALTGARPTLIRCLFGEYDDHVISAIRSIGMEPIQWDVERYHTAQAPAGACLREPNGQRSVRSSWAADPQQQCGHYGIYESGCLCDQSDSRRRY